MNAKVILRVKATDQVIKSSYGKLSRLYIAVEGRFERGIREKGLKSLDIHEGERVLEIGFGTGCTLVEIAKSVGESGKAHGIDLTPEMVALAKERLTKERVADRVQLHQGDARHMPYEDRMLDAVYLALTLELFDTPDIPRVLKEIKRTLKPDGRLGVVSLSKEGHESSGFLRFYELAHRAFPKYASCRPIYVEDSVRDAGYKIVKTDELMLGRLFPMKVVVASPQ